MFHSLETIDRTLLIVLAFSLLLKLGKDIVWLILRNPRQLFRSEDHGQCYYLIDERGVYKCCNPFYCNSFMANGQKCPKRRCKGYYVPQIAERVSSAIENNRPISIIFALIDWVANLTSVILIIRTLLEVNTK